MKHMSFYPLLLVFSLMPLGESVRAYELGTHGRMTDQAYVRSSLGVDETLLEDLGLRDLLDLDAAKPLGENYYDVAGPQVRVRTAHPFSVNENRMPDKAEKFTFKGWLMRGAIREDDYTRSLCAWPKNPADDPHPNPPDRPINHFFDPVNHDTISVPFATPKTAPDWALGTTDGFNNPGVLDPNRRNHFTILDAREAMYRALSGRGNDGLTLIGPNNTPADETVRQAYWATTFRALGDVVHLIQDMGQPQHTRKDKHTGGPCSAFAGEKSFYEFYVEARALASNQNTLALDYGNYPIPGLTQGLTRYRDFFSDGLGRGLADYTNRGFLTAGTNIGSNAYNAPPSDASDPFYNRVTIPLDQNAGIDITYLDGAVTDTLNPSSETRLMAVESLWEDALDSYADDSGKDLYRYSFDYAVYEDRADLTVPRAVSYSAGLINHFFRDRLGLGTTNVFSTMITEHPRT